MEIYINVDMNFESLIIDNLNKLSIITHNYIFLYLFFFQIKNF